MPGNKNTKSGILQGLFICRTSELNPRIILQMVENENIPSREKLDLTYAITILLKGTHVKNIGSYP